jgi:beta-glucanase (GH16 family)
MNVIAPVAALALAAVPPSLATAQIFGPAPKPLDLCDFRKTFSEDFNTLSVAPRSAKDKRWIAHTPWNGDFGDAEFTDPGPNFPFTVKDGILSIEARKDAAGKWRSGLLASADADGHGFTQLYGYFEARMKLPKGPGVWPAFWLGSSEPPGVHDPTMEVDVIESYGHAPDGFQSAVHLWDKNGIGSDISQHNVHHVVPDSLSNGFNRYGVEVTKTDVVYYLNGQEIWRAKTPPEHKHPLFPMVDLALGSGFPIDKTPNPSVLEVDYIHVYVRDPAGRKPGCVPDKGRP